MVPVYLKWCSYGSFVRYAFEGSLISIYGPDFSGEDRAKIACDAPNGTKKKIFYQYFYMIKRSGRDRRHLRPHVAMRS